MRRWRAAAKAPRRAGRRSARGTGEKEAASRLAIVPYPGRTCSKSPSGALYCHFCRGFQAILSPPQFSLTPARRPRARPTIAGPPSVIRQPILSSGRLPSICRNSFLVVRAGARSSHFGRRGTRSCLAGVYGVKPMRVARRRGRSEFEWFGAQRGGAMDVPPRGSLHVCRCLSSVSCSPSSRKIVAASLSSERGRSFA